MCMEDVLILQEYGTEVMGQKDLIFYGKLIPRLYFIFICVLVSRTLSFFLVPHLFLVYCFKTSICVLVLMVSLVC